MIPKWERRLCEDELLLSSAKRVMKPTSIIKVYDNRRKSSSKIIETLTAVPNVKYYSVPAIKGISISTVNHKTT